MPPFKRLLGSRVDCVTAEDVQARVQSLVQSRTPSHLITTNTLMLLEAEHDPALRAILEQAALSIPESSGIRLVGRLLRNPFPAVLPGIDLMMNMCENAAQKGQSLFLLGSAAGTAEAASEVLRRRWPTLRIVGIHHGFFKNHEAEVLQKIRQAAPDYLFVGLGMPAQEKWIAAHLAELGVPVVMGIGGSLDVISGKLSRAPRWMRVLGIEWAYRLYQEPWRWRRIAQLPVFVWKVMLEKRTE